MENGDPSLIQSLAESIIINNRLTNGVSESDCKLLHDEWLTSLIDPVTCCTSNPSPEKTGKQITISCHLDGRIAKLSIVNQKYQGEINPVIGKLKSLVSIDLSHNLFTGKIPTVIATLPRLSTLYLQDNQLSGIIPKEVVTMPSLIVLGLSNNFFEGAIPSIPSNEFKDCAIGSKVDFSCCSIFNLGQQVCIPEKADISSNCIVGSVPVCAKITPDLVFPDYEVLPNNNFLSSKSNVPQMISIIGGAVGGVILLIILSTFLIRTRMQKRKRVMDGEKKIGSEVMMK